MEREIHKALSYEKKEIEKAQIQLKYINKIIWDVESVYGTPFLDSVWTYGSGITFRDLSKERYVAIKDMMPNLGSLEKESSQYGLSLAGRILVDAHNNVSVNITFKWDVPDTCEIKEVTTVEPVEGKYFVGEDDKIYVKKIEKVVECTKPMLESVFKTQAEVSTVGN